MCSSIIKMNNVGSYCMEAVAIMEHSLNQTMSKGLKLTVLARCTIRGLTLQFSTHEHTVDNLK